MTNLKHTLHIWVEQSQAIKKLLKKIPTSHSKIRAVPSADALLTWYDAHGRDLPWRGVTGDHSDYKVWLSEIMLQQTTIVTGTPYYYKFLNRWPTLADMARSSLDDILQAWAGLGYYARARNLHKCACIVLKKYGGRFPLSEDELLTLPGIGPYTAAAMTAILADHPSVVVDGNVERVMSRLYAIETPLPKSKVQIRALAASLTPDTRPGDYAQGLMDLGAMICTPRRPKCDICPWQTECVAFQATSQETYPKKIKKKPKPKRFGAALFLENEKGDVLLTKRPKRGLFAEMWAFPGTRWDHKSATQKPTKEDVQQALCVDAEWERTQHQVRHVFTHFDLEMEIWAAKIDCKSAPDGYQWVNKQEAHDIGLPSLMKKVATLMI